MFKIYYFTANKQKRVALGNNGRIDPESIDDYLAVGGYAVQPKR